MSASQVSKSHRILESTPLTPQKQQVVDQGQLTMIPLPHTILSFHSFLSSARLEGMWTEALDMAPAISH